MARARVRGVLFDLGGTLCDYNAEMGAATGAALARLGFEPTSEEAVGAIVTAAVEATTEYGTRASYLHRDLFRDQMARTVALLGAEAQLDLLDWFEAENRSNIIEHLRPRADAADVLRALGDRGTYRAVVSNADDDFLGPNLARHGLDALLDHWTSSEEAGSCKPDAAIYHLALEKAGLSPDEVLFVGDSLQHDIAGAAGVGMRSALIGNGFGPAAGMAAAATPDFEVRELRELLAILDRLEGDR